MCRFAEIELPASPDAARRARRFVHETVRGWHLDGVADDLALLASELVTNVVLHAGTMSTLTLSVAEGTIEVSVTDRSDALPQIRPTRDDVLGDLDAVEALPENYDTERVDESTVVGDAGSVFSGRGLQLVDLLSEQWGARSQPRGKSVWLTTTAPGSWPWQHQCICASEPSHHTASGHPVAHMPGPWV
ncbi:MAG TPA: ATP-binding protein [Mycobacteriales bacterium]|nr:ATP-binding protein [Mycobacteriales bacterium]